MVDQTPVLIVTGARVLRNLPDTLAWAEDIIESAVCNLPTNAIVVTGDAPGPDACARNLGMLAGLRVVTYELTGYRVTHLPDGSQRVEKWTTTPRPPHGDRQWPLARNEKLIRDVAAAHAAGKVRATCLALLAPWSATHGTEHTARLAEKAGIAVARHVCLA